MSHFKDQGRLDEAHSLGMNISKNNYTDFLFHTMRSGKSESKSGNDSALGRDLDLHHRGFKNPIRP